jgi:hypothetical protein
MSFSDINANVILLGIFSGDAPALTIGNWQSIINVPIYVHLNSVSGKKSYIVKETSSGSSIVDYSTTLQNAGITGINVYSFSKIDHLMVSWDYHLNVGPQVSVIAPIIA